MCLGSSKVVNQTLLQAEVALRNYEQHQAWSLSCKAMAMAPIARPQLLTSSERTIQRRLSRIVHGFRRTVASPAKDF